MDIGQLIRRDSSMGLPGNNDSVIEINGLYTQRTDTFCNNFYRRDEEWRMDMYQLGRNGGHLANICLKSPKPEMVTRTYLYSVETLKMPNNDKNG